MSWNWPRLPPGDDGIRLAVVVVDDDGDDDDVVVFSCFAHAGPPSTRRTSRQSNRGDVSRTGEDAYVSGSDLSCWPNFLERLRVGSYLRDTRRAPQ